MDFQALNSVSEFVDHSREPPKWHAISCDFGAFNCNSRHEIVARPP